MVMPQGNRAKEDTEENKEQKKRDGVREDGLKLARSSRIPLEVSPAEGGRG